MMGITMTNKNREKMEQNEKKKRKTTIRGLWFKGMDREISQLNRVRAFTGENGRDCCF